MLSKLKNLNNKEKPVLYKMKDEIKNIYYTLKSDISIVQYIFLLHTVTDFIKWIKIRKDDAERAIKIILKYKEEYKKATQKIHELQLEVIDLNRKKQQLEIENKKLTAQLLFLLDLIDKKEAEIQALQQEIAIKNQIIAQLEIIIQQKETEIHELKIKYQQDMEQNDNEIAELEKQIIQKQKEIEELKIQYQHEITQKNIEIALLQQQIIEKQKEIEQLKIQYEQEITRRDNEIAILKTQIIEKETQIQELIKQHIKDLEDANAEIEKLKLEIKKYSTQINYLNQAKQLLQEHLKLTNGLMNRQTILTLPEDSVYQPVVVDETLPNDNTESKTDIVEPVMVHIDPKPNATLEPIIPVDGGRITETVSMIDKEEEKISDEMKDEGIQTVSVIGKEEEKHEMPDEMKDIQQDSMITDNDEDAKSVVSDIRMTDEDNEDARSVLSDSTINTTMSFSFSNPFWYYDIYDIKNINKSKAIKLVSFKKIEYVEKNVTLHHTYKGPDQNTYIFWGKNALKPNDKLRGSEYRLTDQSDNIIDVFGGIPYKRQGNKFTKLTDEKLWFKNTTENWKIRLRIEQTGYARGY